MIDTGEEHGGGFPPPSRFRLFGRQMGYTQTECGYRKPWMVLEEYREWAQIHGTGRGDYAADDLMDD